MAGIYGSSMVSESSYKLLKETVEMQNIVIESLLNFDNDSETEILEEGANEEYTKAFKTYKSSYKEACKNAKKFIKEKDFKSAKAETKKMKTACDNIEKVLKETPSTIGSVIYGFLARSIIECIKMIIPVSLTAGGSIIAKSAIEGSFNNFRISAAALGITCTFAGSIISFIKSIVLLVNILEEIADRIKTDKKLDAFNLYKNKLISCIKDMREKIDKLDEIIDKAEKEN